MRKKIARGQWFCLGAVLVMLALMVIVYTGDTTSLQATTSLIQTHKQGVGQLTEDSLVQQRFTVNEDGLCALEVMVSNYNKKVKEGTLTLWLQDADGNELARQTYPVAEMKNNAFVTMTISAVENSAGKQYVLHASSDCTEEKGVTLRMGPADQAVGELVLADGTVAADQALNLRIICEEKQPNVMGGGMMLLIALCFAAGVPLAGGKERRRA